MTKFNTSQASGLSSVEVALTPKDKIRVVLAFTSSIAGYTVLLDDEDTAFLIAALHTHLSELRGPEQTRALLRPAYRYATMNRQPRTL